MIQPFSILAAKNDTDTLMTVVFFLVVAVLWGVGALAKMASKKKEHEHRERVRRELEESRRNAPNYDVVVNQPPVNVPLPPSAPPRPAPVQRQAPPRPPPPVPKTRPPKQKKPKKAPAAPVFAQQPVEEQTVQRLAPSGAAPRPAAAASAKVDANQLKNWLRPQTLREQFILTEILQPPLALRHREE
jgi:outer membrane biosynthesis protein TonB